MSKKSILLLFFLLINKHELWCQNLVPNSDFEDTVMCPYESFSSNLDACESWICPIGTSSDYFNSCAQNSRGVPYNMSGFQEAHSGNAYCGIIINNVNSNDIQEWNEYISVHLNSPLEINQKYKMQLYLNLSDKSQFTASSFGTLFTSYLINPEAYLFYIDLQPQLENIASNYIFDRLNWVELSWTFIADSSYQYLTLGNFHPTGTTNNFDTQMPTQWYGNYDYPYFLIDDVSLTPIYSICSGDSIQLSSMSDSVIGWVNSQNPSTILSTDTVFYANPISDQTYYLYLTNDTLEYFVEVMHNDIINLGNDTNLCENEFLLLNAATSNSNYIWQDGSDNYSYLVSEPGIYWVKVQNSCGTFSDTIVVTYNELLVDLGPDTILCEGDGLILTTNIPNATYFWQNTSTLNNYQIPNWINAPNQYWVIVKNSVGCGIDTINVSYLNYPDVNILIDDFSLCEGSSYTLNPPITNSNYLWSTGDNDSILIVNSPGHYWVEISNNCFTISDSVNISSKPTPFFSFGNDTTICNGESILLSINTIPNSTIMWNNSGFNYNSTQLSINFDCQIIGTTVYQGCSFKDTINIKVENCNNIIIPNVFTPNGDGINDLFVINNLENKNFEIIILNRWGELIHQTNDLNNPWNGKSLDGTDCQEGVYFYTINTEYLSEISQYIGSITLTR